MTDKVLMRVYVAFKTMPNAVFIMTNRTVAEKAAKRIKAENSTVDMISIASVDAVAHEDADFIASLYSKYYSE